MTFTSNCDVFAAVDEEGVNRLIRHVMRQRPSLFNYGTQAILDSILRKRPLWCKPIDVAPIVLQRHNPIISVESPLTVPGTNGMLQLNYLVQLTELQLDAHPGNVVSLPPELSPPLTGQHFALHAQACAGLGCPPRGFFDDFELPTTDRPPATTHMPPPREPVIVPTDRLECFCLDLFVLAHFEPAGDSLDELLQPKVDGVEIVNIEPAGLENSIECLLRMLMQFVVLPKLSDAIAEIVPGVLSKLDSLASLTMVPTPVSSSLPNNPAVEEDKIKMFVDIEEV